MNISYQKEKIKLIVGLGNIGDRFKLTRHNIGFEMLDNLSNSFKEDKNFKGLISEIEVNSKKVLLLKPTTMMNNSGESVQKLMNYFKIKPNEIVLVHDDLDIPFGKTKLQFNKSPKKHNGVISIEQMLGTTKFWRLRFGVEGRNDGSRNYIKGIDYVLAKFTVEEEKKIKNIIKESIEKIL